MAELAPWERPAPKQKELAPWEKSEEQQIGPAPWDSMPTASNVAPEHIADQDDSSAFIRGIKAYAPQTKELWNAAKVITGAGIQRLAGKGDFSDDMIANGLKGIEEAKKEEEPLQAKVAWNDSVNGFITEYLPYMMGQGVANAAEGLLSVGVGAGLGAFFGGGVGAIPGGMAALVEKKLITQGVKELAEKIAEKEGAEAAAKFVANRTKQVITSKGGMLGMATQAAFHGIGEPGSRAIEEIQKKNPDADVAQELNFTKLAPAMAIHTAADFLAEKFGLGEIKGLDAAGKSLLTDIAKVYMTSTAKEIPAELAQQFAERFGADLNVADLDAMKEYAETVVGTFAQGIPSAGVGGVRGYIQNNRDRAQIAEIVKPDLTAKFGREPTPQELTTFVDKVIATRNKMQEEKNAAKNTGDNTGVTQPGVSTPTGTTTQRGNEPGPETNAQSNVVGNEQPADTTGGGTQPVVTQLNQEQVNALQPGETNGAEATQTQQTETQGQETPKVDFLSGQVPNLLKEIKESQTKEPTATPTVNFLSEQVPSLLKEIIDLHEQGLTVEQISQQLYDIPPETVKNTIAELGLKENLEQIKETPSEETPNEETPTEETPSEEEQAALQDELDQELGQNQEPTDEEIADKLLEQSQLEEEQRRQDEENKEDLGEPTPEQIETEQEARNVEAMTDREEKLRHISQTPKLGTLSADLQSNPIVQQYHNLFDQYIYADEDEDTERKDELKTELQTLKSQLPSNHPARVAEGKTAQQLKQNIKKEEKKNKSNSPKVQNADINSLNATVHPVIDDAIRANDFRGALKGIVRYGGDYFSKLAQRLLDLNFSVNIGYNITENTLYKYLRYTAGQRNRIESYLQSFYPHIYNRYFNPDNFDPSISSIQARAEAYNRLLDGRIRIPTKQFTQDIEDAADALNKAVGSLAAAGFYFGDSIALNKALNGGITSNYVLMHESVHAAVVTLMENPGKLTPEQRKAYDNLVKLHEYVVKKFEGTKFAEEYGLQDVHEFVAEAFSNKNFQKLLRQLEYANETNQSTWSKFIHYVSKLIGINNVLFQTMANTDVLFSAKENAVTTGVNGATPRNAVNRLSVATGKFKTNTDERKGMLGAAGDIIRSRLPWSKVKKKNLESFLRSTSEQYRRHLLGGLTLDQLTDIVGDRMPQFQQYVKEVDAMIYTRNQILAEGDKPIKLWSELQERNPVKAEQLSKVMLEATLRQIEPDTTGKAYDAKEWQDADKDFKDAWHKMLAGPDGKVALEIYREVRAFYERRMAEYLEIQTNRVIEREKAKGTPADEITGLVRSTIANINEGALKLYFPVKRFGDYWLQTDKGKGKVFQQFEDAFARDEAYEQELNRLIAAEKKKNPKLSDEEARELVEKDRLQYGNSFSEVINSKLADWSHLERLKDLIESTTQDIAGSNDPKITVDPVGALRDRMKDEISQLYLELMPNESINKMFLHRDNVSGASIDMLRAFEVSRLRMAYQRSRFEHLPQLFNTLHGAEQFLKTMPAREAGVLRDYVHELELNLKTAILNPPKQSGVTTALANFGFLNYLTSPASAIVNMLAVAGIWAPAANARYGLTKTSVALAKFNRLLGGTGFVNESTGRYEFWSLARANMEGMDVKDRNGKSIGKTYADVYQEGVRRGVIDVTLSHEAAQIGEQPSKQYTGRWQKVMYYASLPFHSAEKYNRETTFMATFELAYNKALTEKTHEGKPRYTSQQAFDVAVQEARDLVQQTMFNYNTINKPRYFRGDYRNILLQFKMYPQHMTALMFRTFYKAMNGGVQAELIAYEREIRSSPHKEELMKAKIKELEGVKREARDQFLGMMGMAFLTSGITGLPFWFIFSSLASAFHAIFGDSDEPFDAENWFKNWCNRNLGGFLGDSMSRGLLSQATGINFADRMSLNIPDMWFPDVRKSKDELTYVQNAMVNLLGPSAGALITYAEAYDRFSQGHTERAIETAMPSAIKNIMAGTRYLVEGKVLTMKGDTLMEEVPDRYALAQMLGFTPEKIAQAQKANIEMKNAEQKIINRHNDLLNAFFIALDSGDTSMMDRVIAKIIHFSQTNPGKAIMPNDLFNSVKQRYENRALANITGGMGIDKKLIPQLQGWREYGETEE